MLTWLSRCRYLRGQVTEKNDVYSFGVVLLELLSGRRALVSEQFDLVQWATAIIRGPPPILDKILDLSIKVRLEAAHSLTLNYRNILDQNLRFCRLLRSRILDVYLSPSA